MLRRRLLVTIIASSIIVFSIIWFSNSVEVTARIVEKETFTTEPGTKSPIVFRLDNGDQVEVSKEDFLEHQEGDLFTYRKSLAEIYTPFVYDFGFLYAIFWIGLVVLIGLTIFVGFSSVAAQIRNREANSEAPTCSGVKTPRRKNEHTIDFCRKNNNAKARCNSVTNKETQIDQRAVAVRSNLTPHN